MVARLAVLALLAGCADEVCLGVPMSASEAGLVVTADEHPDAWGIGECVACHAVDAIHRDGCSPGVDPVALQRRVDRGGPDGCVDCHGTNGVTP